MFVILPRDSKQNTHPVNPLLSGPAVVRTELCFVIPPLLSSSLAADVFSSMKTPSLITPRQCETFQKV